MNSINKSYTVFHQIFLQKLLAVIILSCLYINSAASSDKKEIDTHNRIEKHLNLTVSGKIQKVSAKSSGNSLELKFNNLSKNLILPDQNNGIISELFLSQWIDGGVILSIEVRESKSKFSYYWASFDGDTRNDGYSLNMIGLEKYHVSNKDYNLSPAYNSQGDSIYIILSNHSREGSKEQIIGNIYVNNCPRGPGIGKITPLQIPFIN